MIPTLNDLTFQYTDSGVLLNGPDNVFPIIDVENVKGLDSATFRTSFKDTEGQDGSTVEADFESVRTIVLSGTVIASSTAELEPALDTLKSNFAPSTSYQPLYFKAPGVDQRQVFCKCISGFRYDWATQRRTGLVVFQVVLQAGDPIIYGIVLNSATGNLTTGITTGFTFPFGFPFGFGATVTTPGTFSIYNNGNRPVPFTAVITGTVTNPGLRHEGLSRTVSLGVSVGSGSTLIVDFGNNTATLDEQNVSGKITKEGWFLLQPGENPLRFLADTAAASVTVNAYDGWR